MKLHRNNKGATNTVEVGCGLTILLLSVLIPCIHAWQVGFFYVCGWYCNHEAVREAACRGPGSAEQAPMKTRTRAQEGATAATDSWAHTGLGIFCNPVSYTSSVQLPTPCGADIDGDRQPDFCKVTTLITFRPLVLNQPIQFQYVSEMPYEEKQ